MKFFYNLSVYKDYFNFVGGGSFISINKLREDDDDVVIIISGSYIINLEDLDDDFNYRCFNDFIV